MTPRPTLYLMVAMTMISTCDVDRKTNNLGSKVDSIESQLKTMQPTLQVENVLGDPEPEKFYEIDGQRVYLEMDGKPVEQYCK